MLSVQYKDIGAEIVSGIGCASGSQWSCFDKDGDFYRFESNEFNDVSNCSWNVTAFAISPDANHCAVAFDKSLHICKYPDVKSIEKHTVARFTLDITKVEYDCSGKFIFISTLQGDIHIYSCASNKIEILVSSSKKGVLSFATLEIDTSLYVALIAEGGDIKLFHVSVEKGPLGKQYVNADMEFITSAVLPNAGINCCVSFSQQDGMIRLAVPSRSGSLNFISKASESTHWVDNIAAVSVGTIKHNEVDVCLVRFSPNGEYLLSADVSGRVVLWDSSDKDLVALRMWGNSVEMKLVLLDMQWGTKADSDNCALVLTDSQFCKLDDVVNVSLGHRLPTCTSAKPAASVSSVEPERTDAPAPTTVEADVAAPAKKASRLSKNSSLVSDEATDGGNDDDNLNFLDEIAEESANNVSVKVPRRTLGDGEDMIDDDANSEAGEQEDMDEDDVAGSGVTAEDLALQPPIQLSSTSVDERGRKYLIWNDVGSIISREESTGSNRIEIRFSNSFSSNKQENLQDLYGYTMTAMSNEGALFASPAEPVDDNNGAIDRDSTGDSALDMFLKGTNHAGSVIYYHAFSGSKSLDGTPNESFQMTLSYQEEATAVACGTGWCAVSTSNNYLRLFSSTGIQLSVISLKGDVVSMVGDKTKLAVVYHQGIPVAGRPTLALDVFNITENSATKIQCAVQNMAVPLSRGATLTWTGFDVTEGCLTVMDSQGVLRALFRAHCNIGTATNTTDDNTYYSWSPVLETERAKKHFDHTFWPVAVKGHRLLYVLLNGQSKPAIFPQPVMSTIHYKIPVVELRESTSAIKDKDDYNDQLRAVMMCSMKLTHAENDRQEAEDALCNSSHALNAVTYSNMLDTLEGKCDTFQRETDSSVLKAYQRACQMGKQSLAIDLIMRYVRGPKALAVAVTIANHHGRAAVARIIDDYAKNLQDLADEAPSAATESAVEAQSSSYTDFSTLKSVLKTAGEARNNSSSVSINTGRKLVKKSQAAVSPDSPGAEENPQVRVTFSGRDEYSQPEEDFSQQSPPSAAQYTQEEFQSQVSRVSPAMKKAPMKNPFAIGLKQPNTSSPQQQNKGQKRKAGNIFDEVKHNLTTSPSPVKKPLSKLNTATNITNKLAF